MALNTNPLPLCRAAELAVQSNSEHWLIRSLWGYAAVGIIGGAPKCGLCRARHKPHYPASRIMPRDTGMGLGFRRFPLANAA